jgi:hypothetical protein
MVKKSKKSIFPILLVITISIIVLASFKKSEGFQSSSSLAAVGVRFKGSLSSIYNYFASQAALFKAGGAPDSGIAIITSPATVLVPMLNIFPNFLYYIVSTTTKTIVYNPIAEYKTTGKISPFPSTTTVDDYIIYCNLSNISMTSAQMQTYYPQNTGSSTLLPNCSTQAVRTNTETKYSNLLSLMKQVQASNNAQTDMQNLINNPTDAVKALPQYAADQTAIAAQTTACTTTPNSIQCSAAQNAATNAQNVLQSAIIPLLSSADQSALNNTNSLSISLQNILNDNQCIGDLIVSSAALIISNSSGVTYETVVYAPCSTSTPSTYTASDSLASLYDSNGNLIFNSSGLTTLEYVGIGVGAVALIGGIYLFTRGSGGSSSNNSLTNNS